MVQKVSVLAEPKNVKQYSFYFVSLLELNKQETKQRNQEKQETPSYFALKTKINVRLNEIAACYLK